MTAEVSLRPIFAAIHPLKTRNLASLFVGSMSDRFGGPEP